jgi:Uncharacterized protein conserved in bacteria (DUF2213)
MDVHPPGDELMPAAARKHREKTVTRPLVTDSRSRLVIAKIKWTFDKGSTRDFDSVGRMHVSVANISKANICPYRGDEIPGYEELGLKADQIYQMLRDPRELEAAAPTFNGVQLLKKHVAVDADDHQMWDIVGTTGTDAKFDGKYLTNSLHVWTKEGIEFIESGDQRELSCGYHYVPDMTPGNFGGKRYDGIMRNIEGNHVALVEEGRAGPDVIVGDSALSERDRTMKKPTRLEYAVLMRTASAINPLLAMDAKVNYAPIVKGLTTKNFKDRRKLIVDGVKKLIAGKTIAKDASVEHLAKMLDTFEHTPESKKSWDESVSEPQHKAMEAAANGESSLGIPKTVGKEFADADKGKKFGDMIRDWAKDKGMTFGDEDFEAFDKMHADCMDETPEEAEDEDDEDDLEEEGEDEGVVEEGAEEAEDEESEEDDDAKKKAAKDKAAKDKAAKDKAAKDKAARDRKGAMDKRGITQDELNKAISSAVGTAQKQAHAAAEAREFVAPYVGKVPLALDSAEKILRSAAKAMEIEDADTVHPSALKQLIKMAGQSKIAMDQVSTNNNMVFDHFTGDDSGTFEDMFPGASRIGMV